MLRLSRQARIFSPTLHRHRIFFRKYSDQFISDGTEHGDEPNDTAASDNVTPKMKPDKDDSQSRDLWWDRVNRLDDKMDGALKDHGKFKVDVTRSIGELGNKLGQSLNDLGTDLRNSINKVETEMHKEFATMRGEFATVKSDQKITKWQVHFLFIAASSLVLWSLKDYIQIRFPILFAAKEEASPKQPDAPFPSSQAPLPQAPEGLSAEQLQVSQKHKQKK